ncbi:MAG: hypothetical protein ABR572_01580 [Cryomorphaceae bacterium]|nr:hypothetical protein [Flavobacteriales bacterium]
MRKVSIVMERFWLVIAIGSLLVVLYIFIAEGIDRRTLQYLIFPALAGSMYAFRHLFRKRMEGKDQE